jgi:hypothetical protein
MNGEIHHGHSHKTMKIMEIFADKAKSKTN